MRRFVMFVTAVCILFLLKLKWPKNKSLYNNNNSNNNNSNNNDNNNNNNEINIHDQLITNILTISINKQ